MVARYLITTADEKTWPKNQPLLFIGEWCKRYRRKKYWQSFDSLTLNYHWDDRRKLKTDYIYLQNVYELLLIKVSERLNDMHNKSYSVRYWRILIGPWLTYFIHIIFDRWSMLSLAINDNEIIATNVLQHDLKNSIPRNMQDFLSRFVMDDWNEVIYGQLLERYFYNQIKINFLKSDAKKLDKTAITSWRSKVKNIISKFMSLFNRMFVKSTDYFFIATYMPLIFELKLQLNLGQIPKIWRPVQVSNSQVNLSLRQWQLKNDQADSFIDIMCDMVPLHIPIIYLEGFQTLSRVCDTLYWPKNPRSIFTSNSYSEDEVFKCWTAGKTELGIPLIIGQHGGHFGVASWGSYEDHQIKIADHWISWGWGNKAYKNIRPLCNLKNINRRLNYDPNGNALIVELLMPRYSYCLYAAPIASQVINYFDEQYKFVKALPENLQSKLLIRLYKFDYGWDQVERWADILPNIQIETGGSSIKSLIRKSRICISTYNATTFLDSLYLNVPTLIFWDESYWELRENAKPYFDLLKSVGIFHDTPESAANHLIDIWDNIDDWWLSDEVQIIRQKFCNQYSKSIADPITAMNNLLNNIDQSTSKL